MRHVRAANDRAARLLSLRRSLKKSMRSSVRSLAAVAFLSVSSLSALDAMRECKEPGSICADFDKASFVFVGKVENVSPDATEGQVASSRPQTVGFTVIDGFKNAISGYLTLTFNVAAPDERAFKSGETVLVYALATPARGVSSVACTRTRQILPDDPETATLRELALKSPGAVIEGSLRVLEGATPPALPAATPLARLTVSAESLDRGDVLTATSGSGGYFTFPWMPPGRYRLTFDSPLYAPVTRDIAIDSKTRCLTLDPIVVKLR